MKTTITLYIDAKLWQAYKIHCIKNRSKPSHEVEEFLRRQLKVEKQRKQRSAKAETARLKALIHNQIRLDRTAPAPAPGAEEN